MLLYKTSTKSPYSENGRCGRGDYFIILKYVVSTLKAGAARLIILLLFRIEKPKPIVIMLKEDND